MRGTRDTDVVGDYEISIIKLADKLDNVFAVAWAWVGAGVFVLSNGWFGWGADMTEARWSVQVWRRTTSDQAVTVHTAVTSVGAKRASHRVRRVVATGDEEAIRALLK